MSTTRVSTDEYLRMVLEGKFARFDRHRFELIEGELREMSPIGPPHAHVVTFLTRWSIKQIAELPIDVHPQCPLELPEQDSVPEPDVMWVNRGNYFERWPQPAETLLVIEVADTSRAYDLGEKRELYAAAGIREYWVVDVNAFCVHVFREPREDAYRTHVQIEMDESVSPLALPSAILNVAEMFARSTRGPSL